MAGFDNDVVYGSNIDFSGNATVSAQMTADGQLLIGSSTGNPNTTTLTEGYGQTVTNASNAITLVPHVETTYVVDSVAGSAPYQTIQAAITAAETTGVLEVVLIRSGTYTEDLTFTNGLVALVGSGEQNTTISGTHTPPASGILDFRNIAFNDATAILSSAVAGTTTIKISLCSFNVTNGYSFDLLNWTGSITICCSTNDGTDDGFLNNTGGAAFFASSTELGDGTANTLNLSGSFTVDNTRIECPVDIQLNSAGNIYGGSFTGTLTLSNNADVNCFGTTFNTGASIAITQNSSNSVVLSNVTINSSAAPDVITGTGTVEFGSVSYPASASINAGITKQDVTQIESGRTHVGTGTTNNTYYIEAVEENIGGNVRGRFNNTDNTNATSNAALFCTTGGASAGDPYIQVGVTGGGRFSLGIDNSDLDNFKITDGANPSSGNILYAISSGGASTFNNAFTFPTADGASGEVLKTDGSGNVSWVTAAGLEGTTNLGITYSGSTLSVTASDGTALSSSNPGYVTLSDKSSPGQKKIFTVTANQGFIDDTGASEIIGNLFGLQTGAGYSNDLPFFIYAVSNDAEDTVAFMVSRVPHALTSPAVANIGAPDDPVADTTGSFFSFENIDETLYDGNPLALVGAIRMQMSAADDWTVQPLDDKDGIGQFYDGRPWTYAPGQFANAAGSMFASNGGTAPIWTNHRNVWSISKDGVLNMTFSFITNTTPGVGAVTAIMYLPYNNIQDGVCGSYFISSTSTGVMYSTAGGTSGAIQFAHGAAVAETLANIGANQVWGGVDLLTNYL